jgi:hypothetical protein
MDIDRRWSGTATAAAPGSAAASAVHPHSRCDMPERPVTVRPDVSVHFTVALVSALTSGFFLAADLLRENVGLEQIAAFAAVHPMSYILGGCLALLAVLLTVGDV